MTLWLKVTTDQYELPLAVADTIPELARMTGCTVASLYSIFSRKRKGKQKYPGYVEVIIDEDRNARSV